MGDVSPSRRRLRRLRPLALGGLLASASLLACSNEPPADPALVGLAPAPTPASASHPRAPYVAPVTRLSSVIDESQWSTLAGNVPPAANPGNDVGPIDDGLVLPELHLVLKRSPEVEAGLATFMEDQLDSSSPNYHHWLTPTELGAAYGPTDADLATLRAWLESKGFVVGEVFPSRISIQFTGTAAQVQAAFHTTLRTLQVRGVTHFSNMTEPQIPAALSGIVAGVTGLHDFQPRSMRHDLGQVRYHRGTWSFVGPQPAFTVDSPTHGTFYAVAPADFATIYNMNPVFEAGYRGAGQTIGLMEQTTILGADFTSFRAAFGLSSYAGALTQVNTKTTGSGYNCAAPTATANDEGEAALDAEWAGATAPDAAILMWGCKQGVVNAMGNAIAAGSPKIVSMSYGGCEATEGASFETAISALYQTGAASGMSIFVSSDDSAGSGCDDGDVPSQGLAVNGLGSTPYNVAVGGTDFMDTYDHASASLAVSRYWSATNSAVNGSALSYIPEIPWNGSCASQLLYSLEGYSQAYSTSGTSGFCNASGVTTSNYVNNTGGGGGASISFNQPSWQTGVQGIPTTYTAGNHNPRYMPDVSLFAANGLWSHFYVYCMSDSTNGGVPCDYSAGNADAVVTSMAAGGTSFASPAMAGIQALVNQKLGTPVGNPNAMYYALAAAEYGTTGNALCDSDRGPTSAPLGPIADVRTLEPFDDVSPNGIIPPTVGCVFYDVTKGDMDSACKRGTTDCFGSKGTYGALSTSTTTFSPAYPAGSGWDYATGLGTINVNHLVNGW
jgi:subtilase family serine protease